MHRGRETSREFPLGTRRGLFHSKMWGEILKERYVDPGFLDPACPSGQIRLHAVGDHAHEMTAQSVYEVLCGRSPDVEEFQVPATVVGLLPVHEQGTPWYLESQLCSQDRVEQLEEKADSQRLTSEWWNNEVQDLAAEVARITGHEAPDNREAGNFLESILDCVVVHSCGGLDDTPPEFLDDAGLPNLTEDSLFNRMNRVTMKNEAEVQQAKLNYGYYFAVLDDQLRAIAAGDLEVPKFTLSVMGHQHLHMLLALYGLSENIPLRPPYLSSLTHELYGDPTLGDYFVRVLFNGEEMHVCGPESAPLCPLEEWSSLVESLVPQPASCPDLFEDYHFLTPRPPIRFPWWVTLWLAVLCVVLVVVFVVCLKAEQFFAVRHASALKHHRSRRKDTNSGISMTVLRVA